MTIIEMVLVGLVVFMAIHGVIRLIGYVYSIAVSSTAIAVYKLLVVWSLRVLLVLVVLALAIAVLPYALVAVGVYVIVRIINHLYIAHLVRRELMLAVIRGGM